LVPSLAALALVSGFAPTLRAQCLNVGYNANSTYQQSGIMFDVVNVSADPIRITSIDQAAMYAGTTAVHLYTKVGTWNGSQLTPAAWTLVGSNPAWVHPAFPARTPLGIAVDVVIPPGGSQGFYVGATFTGQSDLLAFRHGSNQLGTAQASDGTLEIRTGITVYYPFALTVGLPTNGMLWLGRVHYCKAATNTTFGAGCGSGFNSVYGSYADAALAQPALSGNVLRLQRILNGYVGTWENGTAALHYATPPAGAASLATGDDGFVPVTLPSALPTPYGPRSVVAVSGNGIVSFGPTVDTPGTNPWLPTADGFLQSTHGGVYAWHDYNPNEIGSGQIRQHQVGPRVCFTWQDVESYPIGIPNRSTMQIQCNLANGDITIVFVAIDGNPSSPDGSSHLIGVTAPGSSLDPSPIDLATAGIVTASPEGVPLSLTALNTPIAGQSWMLLSGDLPLTTAFGFTVIGFTDPGIDDLTSIGLPGCGLRASLDVLTAFTVPYGAPVHPWSITVPANTPFGLQVFATTIVATNPATNALGLVTSNGIRGVVNGF
nr:hypothetical protein [Planctomycetota bacterium]